MEALTENDSANSVSALDGEVSIMRPRFYSYGGKTHESALIDELRGNKVGVYKPVYVERGRDSRGRMRTRRRPVFPYKLFVSHGQQGRDIADRNHRVAGVEIIPESGQGRLKDQLAQVEYHLAEQSADPYPDLKIGLPVRVKSGPFEGKDGTIDYRMLRHGREVFTVRLNIMGQSVSTEIDPALLEAA